MIYYVYLFITKLNIFFLSVFCALILSFLASDELGVGERVILGGAGDCGRTDFFAIRGMAAVMARVAKDFGSACFFTSFKNTAIKLCSFGNIELCFIDVYNK